MMWLLPLNRFCYDAYIPLDRFCYDVVITSQQVLL